MELAQVTFKIETELPTLNEYINAERTNKYIASAMKKKYTNICAMYARQIPKQEDKLYDLAIHWVVTDNRKDADNIYAGSKFLIDGMVEAGIIPNDGRKNIRNISHSIETGKKYCITVTLIETLHPHPLEKLQ